MELLIRKVAMTGGSGPIGLALINKLISENVEILLFQRKNSAKCNRLPKHRLLHVEYYALEELHNYCPEEHDYDVFFHLGWANTGGMYRDDLEKQIMNIPYACTAVKLAYKLGCHSFIGIGSQAEYGRKNEALRGDMLCEPETAYGIMKLCACYSTRMMCKRYRMRHVWARVLSGYGLYDNDGSVLISNIIKSLKGESLAFSKGEQIWDFVHMDDIANALYLIAQKGNNQEIYPIGSGNALPLKNYMGILCNKLGESIEDGLGKIPYSEKQIMHLEADISKLQQDTGWTPQISFEEGIEQVISFYKNWEEMDEE